VVAAQRQNAHASESYRVAAQLVQKPNELPCADSTVILEIAPVETRTFPESKETLDNVRDVPED
jgi:hypothetical protein